ncbi:hypothetical protein DFH08DRAFT_823027 [Mycena albidolilacea]|uniref:Uncharacterized protein n=1 Tax=Mycena albidolilacea TaxID=1033008 RepID=A0AAD6Z6X9_9AGAR|nr:hypothetical protein DFH08DRAFT_823027 [Mycena albidolilacea]
MSGRQVKIIRTPSYWAEYHRRRREHMECAARSPPAEFRAAPLLTVVQNDGCLLTIPPGPLDPNPPPPPPKRVPKLSAAAARAKALLDARPSPDEVLLARLNTNLAKDIAVTPRPVAVTVVKRKACSDIATEKSAKR